MADYCFAALGEHEQNQCGEYLFGGSDAAAILELDHAISDWSDPAEWAAAIAADKARIIKGIKLTFPEPSPVEGPSGVACGPENKLNGFNFTVTWTDFNVNGVNDDFYAQLNKRTLYLVWRECSEAAIRVVERKTLFQALPASLPESDRENQVYQVTASFTGKPDYYPVRYNEPTGIFD